MPKVILSSNDHDKYFFFAPIAVWMWKKFGFDTLLFMPEKEYNNNKLNFVIKSCQPHVDTTVFFSTQGKDEGVSTKAIRLYASAFGLHPEDYIITSDINLIPLCDLFYRDFLSTPDKINLYGHDLTGYKKYPVSYVGAKVKNWRALMGITEGDFNQFMHRDLDKHLNGDMREEHWGVDQDILTSKILTYGVANCNHISRGRDATTSAPLGRVEYSDWSKTIQSPIKIDGKLPSPGYSDENFERIVKLIAEVLPNENLMWLVEYRNKYLELL